MRLRALSSRRRGGRRAGAALAALVALGPLGGCVATGGSDGVAPVAPVDGSTAAAAAEDAAIRGTLDTLNATCAARDVDGFMHLFDAAEDVLLVGSEAGEVFRGRRAIRGFATRLFALPFRYSFDLSRTTVARHGDVAWVFVDGEMVRTGDQGGAAGRVTHAPYRITIVMLRRGDGWRWQLFHGAEPTAP